MKMFEPILKVVFAMTAVGVGCYPLYAYWKIYQLYKLAGERVEKIGFFWFAFRVQSPGFGGGVEMLEALPRDLQRLATSVRDRQRKFSVAIVLWIAFLILLGTLVTRLSDGQ
jgi:hypothetical protein